MNTIVKHRRTGNEYVLLSINGDTNPANPSKFISELFNQEKSVVSFSASVCDAQGNIFLAYIDDLIVTSINGQKPDEILPRSEPSNNQDIYSKPYPPDEFVDEDFEEENFSSDESPVDSKTEANPSSTSEADDDWV